MKIRTLLAVVLVTSALTASAQRVTKVFRADEKFPIAPNGTLILENPIGDIRVEGSDVAQIEATIVRTITGLDEAAIQDARQQTGLVVGGDGRTRVLRFAAPPRGARWDSSAAWTIRMPSTASLRIISRASRHIIVNNISGAVQVRNFNGNILLGNTTGPVVAESVNGSMHYRSQKPGGDVQLSSVNGGLNVSVAGNARLQWIAESAKGDILTNLPVSGQFTRPVYRGSLNGPGGPTVKMSTLMGRVQLLGIGEPLARMRSVAADILPAGTGSPGLPASGPTQVHRNFFYETNIGDVRMEEIRGDADIRTGAGEVRLGSVTGSCRVRSQGGPLHLGEIFGPIVQATTTGGDIHVGAAHKGGTIATQGGIIRLDYTGGPTRLYSGGGDIIVRKAAGAIDASTKSGDISIRLPQGTATESVEAATSRGNVVLYVGAKFAADVDVTILTDDPLKDVFLSDIPGLSISRDEFGGKTRIRATGRINGGGDRVVLRATDGGVRLSTALAP